METFLFPKFRTINPTLPHRNISRNLVVITAVATSPRHRRTQNVDGDFFVDHRCIDCDTCRWMAPETFTRIDEKSAVVKQPSCQEERFKALQALLSCPTSSIHTEKPPKEILEVHETFPLPIDEQRIPGVYHCGYHCESSYGATSYFIVHPGGNILVDSPRYSEILARKIEMLGGARYMFLTHKDDVGDHYKWSKRLGCERILHSGDMDIGSVLLEAINYIRFLQEQVQVEVSTADVEMKLYGDGPWNIGTDFELVHTPGHTKGSVCLYYKSLKVLFTGDHIAKSEASELSIFEQYNQLSVNMQLNSVRKFLGIDLEWILPGHGRRIEFKDSHEKNRKLETFLAQKEQVAPK